MCTSEWMVIPAGLMARPVASRTTFPCITRGKAMSRSLLNAVTADQWDGRPHLGGTAMCQSGGVYQPT